MIDPILLRLCLFFVPLSLVSFGGTPTILPELQRYTVDVTGWLSRPDFINIFALSQIAPGPGTFIATLVGWKVAGWSGALVATLAFSLPSSLLFFGITAFFRSGRAALWGARVEQGLVPVAIGLIIAGSYSVLSTIGSSPLLMATAAISAVALLWSFLSPLFTILVVASAFVLGFYFGWGG